MKKKIITIFSVFIITLFLMITGVNAQTMGEIQRLAEDDIEAFFRANIESVTDGSTDVGTRTHSKYCMDIEDHGDANRKHMKTTVVDVGANGMSSVNDLSTTNSTAAKRAMQVLYYATKSYENREPWAATQKSPYRLMMQMTSGMYASTMVNAGLFSSGLPGGVKENYVKNQFGSNIYNDYKKEGEKYVNSTVNYKFKDNSTKDTQTIYESGNYVFVGPYSIQNSKTDDQKISKAIAVTKDGAKIEAEGWATLADSSKVNWNLDIPNKTQFYLVFNKNKPSSVKKVELTKETKNVLRARMVFFEEDGGQNLAIYAGKLATTSTDLIELPGVPFSSIKITKKDQESGKLLPNVGFIAYLEGQGYLKNTVPVSFTSDKKQAYVYRSNTNGVATINNLNKNGKYTIYEVDNPNPGYIEADIDNPSGTMTVTVSTIGQTVNTTMTNKRLFQLKIKKIDQDSKKPIANIGFIVYCPGKGYVKDGRMATYVQDKKQATIYKTDANGEVIVKHLPDKTTYTVYEVINPHFGYKEVSIDSPLEIGKIAATEYVDTIQSILNNKRIYVKLSGYAFEDGISGKQSERNGTWDNNVVDKRLKNITVTLKKVDGSILDTRVTNTIKNTKGNSEEGAYLFGDYQRDKNAKKIKIEDLKGATIEFEYNGMCYKSVKVQPNADNGNKATDDKARPEFNNTFATIEKGIAKNPSGNKTHDIKYSYKNHKSTVEYGGKYQYGYNGQKYPISGISKQYMLKANTKDATPNKLLGQKITLDEIYKQGIEEVPNINLGVQEREMPDTALVQDIDNAQIRLNGYTHTYNYNQRFENPNGFDGDGFNASVKFGNKYGTVPYTREIYSSDIVYNKQPGNEGKLQVYITYKVALRNESTTLYTQINEFSNYFDQRYNVVSIKDSEGNKLNYNQVEERNGYKQIRVKANQKLNHETVKYVYIEYQLNNEAVNSILNQTATLNSVSEVTSYSTYDEKGFTNRYAGIDKDSEPNTAVPGNKDTYEDDTDSAPSLLVTPKEARVIKGTVWEDNAIEQLLKKSGYDKERKGNGKLDAKENLVEKVKVELLTDKGNNNYEISKLYQFNKTTKEEKVVGEAITNTNSKGEYEFNGIIPGKYVLRYTYGNESVIYNPNGTKVTEVNPERYKSTIYRNGDKAEAESTNEYWYRNETGNAVRLSDAKDEIGIYEEGTYQDTNRKNIVEQRTTQEVINNKIATQDNKLKAIEANTRRFDIKLEYDVNLDNISKYGADLKFVFDNIDFGIIKRPIQALDVRKEISFVEVVLANGQTIISGDPRKDDIPYVKFLPDGNVYIEIDNEIMQGATITVRYEIIVNNTKCEIDYNNKDYYHYGIVPQGHAGWKIATVTDIFDYKSNGLNYTQNEANSSWEQIDITHKLVEDGILTEEAYNIARQYTQVLHLNTKTFANMKPNQEERVTMELNKVLSNNQDDFTFDNDIEVITLDGRKIEESIPGNYVPDDSSTSENDNDDKTVVITSPTGENRDYAHYIILGTIALITLGLGIVLIKRMVK